MLGAAIALYGTNLLASCPFDTRRPGYIAMVGAPPVRCHEESSPVTHPAQPAPTAAASPDTPVIKSESTAVGPLSPTPTATAEPRQEDSAKAPGAPTPTDVTPPARLLWDSPPPKVRPEDLLPYFQSPGTSERPDGATFVTPPEPPLRSTSDLPASTATYTQSIH